MSKKPKDFQVVIRLTAQLNRKIEAAANKNGLTKASFVRQMLIENLEDSSDLK